MMVNGDFPKAVFNINSEFAKNGWYDIPGVFLYQGEKINKHRFNEIYEDIEYRGYYTVARRY